MVKIQCKSNIVKIGNHFNMFNRKKKKTIVR